MILHLRYTARQGGSVLGEGAVTYIEELVGAADTSGLALLLSLPHEFPSEWHKFVVANAGSPSPSVSFSANVKREYFPYFTQGKDIIVNAIQILAIQGEELSTVTLKDADFDLGSFSAGLNSLGEAVFAPALVGPIGEKFDPDAPVFILIKYSVESV
ncbi:MAG: hypothetical protein ACREV4_11765 [Gammaproteobacteria bacterium]